MSVHRLLALAAAALLMPSLATAKVKVAASTTDLASIAASVGGDQVEVFAIARPSSDVHRVEALPSYMVKTSRAQVFLKVGLGLDAWADAIIDGSRAEHLTIVDCSRGVNVLDRPTGKVDASMGDIHPSGNPHYWLDPRNGAPVARTIAEALAKADPAHAADFRARAEAFAKDAEACWMRNRAAADALPVKSVFAYHASWVYLAHAFGLEIAANVEPVPGIPPTAKHLAELVAMAKARKIALLVQEPYFSDDAGRFLARETGLRVAKLSPSCDAPSAGSYLAHFDTILSALAGGGGAGTSGGASR